MIDQRKEIYLCANDFNYFCEKYVKVLSSNDNGDIRGVSFKLYDYQKKLAQHWIDNKFSIGSKFRRGGFTTLATIYALWLCLFKMDQKIVFISYNESSACDICDGILKFAINHLPDWLKGNVLKMTNSNQKKFEDTNSNIFFTSSFSSLPQIISLCILDEIDSFMKKEYWQLLYPLCSKAIVQSNISFENGWFWDNLIDSKIGIGIFKEFRCSYKDHPIFNDSDVEKRMRKEMGAAWRTQMDQLAIPLPEEEVVEILPKAKIWRYLSDD